MQVSSLSGRQHLRCADTCKLFVPQTSTRRTTQLSPHAAERQGTQYTCGLPPHDRSRLPVYRMSHSPPGAHQSGGGCIGRPATRPRPLLGSPPIRIHGCPPGGLKSKLEDILVNTESLEWKQQTRICMDVYAKFVVATTQITRSHRPINTDNFCSAGPPNMSH